MIMKSAAVRRPARRAQLTALMNCRPGEWGAGRPRWERRRTSDDERSAVTLVVAGRRFFLTALRGRGCGRRWRHLRRAEGRPWVSAGCGRPWGVQRAAVAAQPPAAAEPVSTAASGARPAAPLYPPRPAPASNWHAADPPRPRRRAPPGSLDRPLRRHRIAACIRCRTPSTRATAQPAVPAAPSKPDQQPRHRHQPRPIPRTNQRDQPGPRGLSPPAAACLQPLMVA